MIKEYLKESLIFICNLAIPANDLIIIGLGDLINFEEHLQEEISPNLFVIQNELFLDAIYRFKKINNITYDNLVKEMSLELGFEKVTYFLEDFRIFAIKYYFSNRFVLDKIKPLQKNYDDFLEDESKDQMILNSLKNHEKY
tara:strand:+ start:45 stop:467 length:423 start_codon:yes stop_codon:yes gene_type:complete